MPRNYNVAKDHVRQAMPGTMAQLVKRSGWHHDTVSRWVRKMRAAGECRIVGWQRPNGSGNFVPVYGEGPGEDAPCTLKPLTPSQDWQIAKQRYGKELLAKRERARHYARLARLNGDPLVQALFGQKAAA